MSKEEDETENYWGYFRKKALKNLLILLLNFVFCFFVFANFGNTKDTGRYFSASMVFCMLFAIHLLVLLIKVFTLGSKTEIVLIKAAVLLIFIVLFGGALYTVTYIPTDAFVALDKFLGLR